LKRALEVKRKVFGGKVKGEKLLAGSRRRGVEPQSDRPVSHTKGKGKRGVAAEIKKKKGVLLKEKGGKQKSGT